MDRTYRRLEGPEWGLTATSIAGDLTGAYLEFQAATLSTRATFVRAQGVRAMERALQANPNIVGRLRYYQDLDYAEGLGRQADDLARQADELAGTSKSLPLKIGAVTAIAGVGYDIYRGKDPSQAAAVGAGSFAASVGSAIAAGAVVGTFVPIPGVGTAVGAVVGAGVGIFGGPA